MAAPHVTAIAALVIASGKLGRNPTPARSSSDLEATARDLGRPGYDSYYGARRWWTRRRRARRADPASATRSSG